MLFATRFAVVRRITATAAGVRSIRHERARDGVDSKNNNNNIIVVTTKSKTE